MVAMRPLTRVMLLLALLWAPVAGSAQAAPAAPAATTDASKPSPAEMQTVLDVLNDPQKRAAFTQTLQAMVHASRAAAPKSIAPAVPLAADSVGAQVITTSVGWVANLGRQFKELHHMLGDLPVVWAFTQRNLNDPVARANLLDAAWHLAGLILAAALVEWGFHLALRRPVAALARHAPDSQLPGGEAQSEAVHDTQDAAEAQQIAAGSVGPEVSTGRQRRLSRTLRALKRVPLMLARLLLELLPVATFIALNWVGLPFLRPETQYVLWLAVTAYAGLRVAVAIARAFVSPDHPPLRVLHVSNQRAAFIVRWVRRLAAWAAFGYAAVNIGGLFGLSVAGREAFIKAVALVGHAMLILLVIQIRLPVARAMRRASGEAGWGAAVAGRLAASWHLVAIFLIGGQWLVWAARVPNGYQRMWRIFLGTAAVLTVWRVLSNVLIGGLERIFAITPETANRYPGLETRAHFYLPVLRRIVSIILFALGTLALVQAWGVNSAAWFRGNGLGTRLLNAGLSVLAVGLVMLVIWELANAQFERRLARLSREAHIAQAARLRTLLPILRTVLVAALFAVFLLNALAEIGVNVGPLLAGAGILGVAIGFGSQKLVQDFITGIFLLLENAMQVGDNVTVAGLSGVVENLSIRTMRLRAGDGSVHIIPFSSVSTVTNVNRGIGNVPVSLTVPLGTDTDHVSDVLADIARAMREERRFADMMRSDFQLWGVDKLEPGAVTVVGQIVCTDAGRWPTQREFNRRLAARLREEGISLTAPLQTVLNLAPEAPPVPQGAA